jgi:hypothetical protein
LRRIFREEVDLGEDDKIINLEDGEGLEGESSGVAKDGEGLGRESSGVVDEVGGCGGELSAGEAEREEVRGLVGGVKDGVEGEGSRSSAQFRDL